jgi:hypothetical protein
VVAALTDLKTLCAAVIIRCRSNAKLDLADLAAATARGSSPCALLMVEKPALSAAPGCCRSNAKLDLADLAAATARL